ncbi:MAG: NlpC/P60 family protein [Pseudomonadota bacterium]
MTAGRSYLDRSTLSAAWVSAARSWLGTPYRHQACRKGVGVDCVGFVAGVWSEVYGAMPEYRRDYTRDWAETGKVDRLLEACRRACCQRSNVFEAEPGDILLFRIRPEAMAKHVAIFSGDHHMIHAGERRTVSEVKIQNWWRRRLVGVFAPPLQSEI